MRLHPCVLLPLIVSAVLGCRSESDLQTGTPAEARETRDAVLAASEAYYQAGRDLDVDRVSSTWTEDAILWSPDGQEIQGREGLRRLIAETFSQMTVEELIVHSREIEPLGDVAIEVGTYSERLRVGAGQPQDLRGGYMFIWKRQADDSWKIHRGIYTAAPDSSAR